MIQLVTLLCMEPISVPGRQKTEGGGKRTTPCHSSFKELLVAGWCPAAAAVQNWFCISVCENMNTCMYLSVSMTSAEISNKCLGLNHAV